MPPDEMQMEHENEAGKEHLGSRYHYKRLSAKPMHTPTLAPICLTAATVTFEKVFAHVKKSVLCFPSVFILFSVFTQIFLIKTYNLNLNPAYILNCATFTQLCLKID